MSNNAAQPADTERGYETRDVNLRAVLWLAIGIAGAVALVHVALWILLQDFNRQAKRLDPLVSPLAAERAPPAAPLLQNAPREDLEQLRAAEQSVLNSYGWIDKQGGTVRIPIDRAMELLIERGETAVQKMPAGQDANGSRASANQESTRP